MKPAGSWQTHLQYVHGSRRNPVKPFFNGLHFFYFRQLHANKQGISVENFSVPVCKITWQIAVIAKKVLLSLTKGSQSKIILPKGLERRKFTTSFRSTTFLNFTVTCLVDQVALYSCSSTQKWPCILYGKTFSLISNLNTFHKPILEIFEKVHILYAHQHVLVINIQFASSFIFTLKPETCL